MAMAFVNSPEVIHHLNFAVASASFCFYQPQGWSTCAAGPGGGRGLLAFWGKGTFSFLETSDHVKPLENFSDFFKI